MRADRLLSILMLLQTKGRMTARDLAEQLEVSERTIYRDLEALSMAGIPIYTERGPGGGCSLLDGYQTRLTGLTETEVRALFLLTMAAPLADLGLGKVLEEALLKLTAALPASSREQVEQVHQRFHVDTTWWYHTADAQVTLQTIQQAIWQNGKLRMVYIQDNGNRCEQIIEPYGLVAKAGVWYLVSADRTGYNVYRVSRIQSVTTIGEHFVRDVTFDLADYWSDYCAQVEHAHPQYAIPLRLAPDEVPTFPQRLHNWGYRLIENDEELEEEEHVYGRPVRHYQQKKEIGMPPTQALPRQRSAHQLFVLDQAGEWRKVHRSGNGKEKKRDGTTPISPHPRGFSAQNGSDGGGGQKKNNPYVPIKKMPFVRKKVRPLIATHFKKSPLPTNKKNKFQPASKKKLFIFPTPAPVCSPLSA
jgi:predicted DNA-binding transcriptional regulator YafY